MSRAEVATPVREATRLEVAFVDVTRATGAYGTLEDLTVWPPYGRIPVPVAEVCRLTWYCQKGDIHARTNGYRVIADLISRRLPRLAAPGRG